MAKVALVAAPMLMMPSAWQADDLSQIQDKLASINSVNNDVRLALFWTPADQKFNLKAYAAMKTSFRGVVGQTDPDKRQECKTELNDYKEADTSVVSWFKKYKRSTARHLETVQNAKTNPSTKRFLDGTLSAWVDALYEVWVSSRAGIDKILTALKCVQS